MTEYRAALLSILLISAAHALPAQEVCKGCKWAERGDRSEGVKTESLMISGGSFELMSVAYLGHRGSEGGDSPLRLSFWMPAAGELDEIRVWALLPSEADREKVSYVMEPSRKEYSAGLADFAWPRGDVIAPLGLALDSLNVLIRSGEVYYPGLLTAREGTAPAGYVFVFESGAGIDADCSIVKSGGSAAAVKSFECVEGSTAARSASSGTARTRRASQPWTASTCSRSKATCSPRPFGRSRRVSPSSTEGGSNSHLAGSAAAQEELDQLPQPARVWATRPYLPLRPEAPGRWIATRSLGPDHPMTQGWRRSLENLGR